MDWFVIQNNLCFMFIVCVWVIGWINNVILDYLFLVDISLSMRIKFSIFNV